jgi:hypothetical protein
VEPRLDLQLAGFDGPAGGDERLGAFGLRVGGRVGAGIIGS